VKKNNQKMYDFIEKIATKSTKNTYQETERKKGKTIKRTTFVYDFDTKDFHKDWHILKSIIVVKREIKDKNNHVIYETAFYVSSLDKKTFKELNTDKNQQIAQKFHTLVKDHWHIENRLHWVKDVIFEEDNNGIKQKNRAITIAIFNNIAINILRKLEFDSISYGSILFACNLKSFINQI
jgi:predicted transposase YbfD/YdcC